MSWRYTSRVSVEERRATTNKMIRPLCFLLCVAGVISMPVDDPIRIDLPVYDQPRASSNVITAEPLERENHPGSSKLQKSDSGIIIPSKSYEINSVYSNDLNPKFPAVGSINTGGGIFSNPVTKIEGAFLETEGYGSKVLSVKENTQNVVAGIFQPKPIVDTIREDEKYGNNGDKFYSAGRAIIGGAEGISNFFNSILEIPGSIIRSITRTATEKLNNLGGRLIGL